MSEPVRMRSLAEARAAVAYLDAVQRKPVVVPSASELERERETLRLRGEFLRLDIRVRDDWSLSGDRRDAPLPAWRRRA